MKRSRVTKKPTQKSIKESVRKNIRELSYCDSIKTENYDFYVYLVELFKNHPDYPEKVSGMVDIKIIRNKRDANAYELNIVRDDGTTGDISWVLCTTKKSKDPIWNQKRDFRTAMRVAIEPQTLEFKETAKMCCVLCKSTTQLEVDHIVTFEKLVKDFLMDHPIVPTSFSELPDNRACFKTDDAEFELQWKDYHRDHASFRILCRECNCRKK